MSERLLAVALGAGMLAAVTPCGFALLPAYLSLLITGEQPPSRPQAVARALGLTGSMTLGFALVFALFGLAIAPIASGLHQHLPWFTVVLGLGLVVLGCALLGGHSVNLPRVGRSKSGRPLTRSFTSMVGFGASYAVASLSWTIAPFLAVVVGGFRAVSIVDGIALFLAYAAGMGLVVGTVAMAIALASGTLVGPCAARTMPFMAKASSRAFPVARPSSPAGPSSHSHVSNRLPTSRSPAATARSSKSEIR